MSARAIYLCSECDRSLELEGRCLTELDERARKLGWTGNSFRTLCPEHSAEPKHRA